MPFEYLFLLIGFCLVVLPFFLLQVISANSFKPIEPVSSFDKFRLMRRLRKIGGILMTLHNVLMMEAPYDLLEKLFRKCCVRCVKQAVVAASFDIVQPPALTGKMCVCRERRPH